MDAITISDRSFRDSGGRFPFGNGFGFKSGIFLIPITAGSSGDLLSHLRQGQTVPYLTHRISDYKFFQTKKSRSFWERLWV
jgi:hypothetical protein